MVLIIARPSDATAAALAARLGAAACLVSDYDLATARWSLRLGPAGHRASVEMPNGILLDDERIGAVLVRTPAFGVPQYAGSTAHGDYAVAEFNALAVAWLQGMGGRCVNRSDPRGFGGASWTPAEWTLLAARSGLRANGIAFATDSRRPRPKGTQVFLDLDPSPLRGPRWRSERPHKALVSVLLVKGAPEPSLGLLDEPLAELARRSGCGLLRVWFVPDGKGLLFWSADPMPELDGAELGRVADDLARRDAHDLAVWAAR